MNALLIKKLIFSIIVVVAVHALFYVLKLSARKTRQKFGIRKSRYFAIRRLMTMGSLLLTAVLLLFVWEISLHNVWISLTGVLAVTAIAFFAIWSLVGNILAGIIIYFTSPFKIEDDIEVMPDEICGTVLAINTFYTVLLDENGGYINIPNALFFQKYIRVKRNHAKHARLNTPTNNKD
ncbi:mechanosensitive ion channel domain-containing protein [Tichowtungia aerotolerans]|uniref:Mechanosensitive ion channel n=1 Tax=Tichowtungia aerotolerans TaxID=2697043 RepID=A0A6P1MBP2_9BACT|nr:mechanosensitive ion channel family protein [Tichowtungia aerotolerans]QHI69964.1 mechanosensitive ion channel [Tichowtungia aerotolerans]